MSEATDYVKSFLPFSVELVTDEHNGRWRLTSETNTSRSISWTKRGLPLAASETILQAWWYHLDSYPTDLPDFSLQELETKVEEGRAEQDR